jgi:hypothetical protein
MDNKTKIGIGVGVAVLLGLGYWAYTKRKSTQEAKEEADLLKSVSQGGNATESTPFGEDQCDRSNAAFERLGIAGVIKEEEIVNTPLYMYAKVNGKWWVISRDRDSANLSGQSDSGLQDSVEREVLSPSERVRNRAERRAQVFECWQLVDDGSLISWIEAKYDEKLKYRRLRELTGIGTPTPSTRPQVQTKPAVVVSPPIQTSQVQYSRQELPTSNVSQSPTYLRFSGFDGMSDYVEVGSDLTDLN